MSEDDIKTYFIGHCHNHKELASHQLLTNLLQPFIFFIVLSINLLVNTVH